MYECVCGCCRNVGNNVFPWLPAAGLQRLLHLKAHNNPNLRHFHPPELFPRIQVPPLTTIPLPVSICHIRGH